MNIRDALKSIIKPHEEDVLTPLTTVFGENLDTGHVLQEYPRPQMVRDSYINLNGFWDYAITHTDSVPSVFQGKILVPFSPEAALSGVNRQLKPDEYLWYRRELPVDAKSFQEGKHLLLHFGAVDYLCTLFINGQEVLTHEGGYLPFEADITPHLSADSNVLILKVQDFTELKSQARGKQTLKRGGIFYTAQSGIWQTVFMEWVSPSYIKKLQVTADYDTRLVTVKALLHADGLKQDITVRETHTVPEEDFHPWSPESPYLYDIEISYKGDTVRSYFAFRSFTIEKKDGIPRFCLNHKPYFLMGVLDQGYWPDGLYTAPSDEALIYDIRVMKKLGFNMLRKHIKVETARWYYHCDRLGMIVCQDIVNGGSTYQMPVVSYLPTLCPKLSTHLKDSHYAALSRKDMDARVQWEKECLETVDSLSFFPSIAIWVPFNEGWGQFDTCRITSLIQEKDPTRLIDSASGWFDQGCGNFISVHNYFRPLSVPVKHWGERAFLLSEYGGYACQVRGHISVERIFGYKHYDTPAEFREAYEALIKKSLLPLQKQGLSGAVYTQLSDVEEEVNGILTYDRKINKLV
jgi:beta-galactosidase/beta-glucuronidase